MDTVNEAAPAVAAPTAGSLSTWYRKYRVVPDNYAGWQAEVWTIWLPVWRQIGFTNTHSTEQAAIDFARRHGSPRML